MSFSTVVLNGGSAPLMHPEMQFRRIVFSTFCPRSEFSHSLDPIRILTVAFFAVEDDTERDLDHNKLAKEQFG
jgi:hypothetical protein